MRIATVRCRMNAIDMLTKQHRQLEAALKKAKDADGSERHQLFQEAADVLMSHVLVEEREFYPAVKAKKTEDILLESLEEHLSLKRLVADLVDLAVTDEHFEPKLQVLKEQSEHHHQEEEEHLFPTVKKLLSDEELEQLGARMQTLQQELLSKKPRELAEEQTNAAAEL
jgi:hemerythrin superfamily protein